MTALGFTTRGGSTAGTLLLALAVGAAAVTAFGIGMRQQVPWTGIAASPETVYRCFAVTDSSPSAGGKHILHARLEWVSDAAGNGADAGGRVLVTFDDDPRLSWGEVFEFTGGRIAIGDTGTAFLRAEHASLRRIGRHSPLYRKRAAVRDSLTAAIRGMDPPNGTLYAALFLGYREDPSAPEYLLFRQAGCAHILALSGMHLGILASLVALLLGRFLGPRAVAAGTLVFIGLYCILVGFRPSLVRAAISFGVLSWSMFAQRRCAPLRVLVLTFLIQVMLFPADALTLSFKLSFLALLGMLGIGIRLSGFLRTLLPPAVAMPIGLSVGAQVGTAALLLEQFGMLRPVGIVSGILVAPLTAVFLWAGTAQVALIGLGFPFAKFAGDALLGMVRTVIIWVVGISVGFPPLVPGPWITVAVTIAAVLTAGWMRRAILATLGPRDRLSKPVSLPGGAWRSISTRPPELESSSKPGD